MVGPPVRDELLRGWAPSGLGPREVLRVSCRPASRWRQEFALGESSQVLLRPLWMCDDESELDLKPRMPRSWSGRLECP